MVVLKYILNKTGANFSFCSIVDLDGQFRAAAALRPLSNLDDDGHQTQRILKTGIIQALQPYTTHTHRLETSEIGLDALTIYSLQLLMQDCPTKLACPCKQSNEIKIKSLLQTSTNMSANFPTLDGVSHGRRAGRQLRKFARQRVAL